MADNDQDIYGFSVAVNFQASRLRLVRVELGGAITGLSPEFNDGPIDNVAGRLEYGVVFDLSSPLTKRLTPGANREVLRLIVDVVGATTGNTTIDLVDVTSAPSGQPTRRTVFSGIDGVSITIAAANLVDGVENVMDLRPMITSIVNGEGEPGAIFFVEGANFNQPGLMVSVGGRTAQHTLLANNTTIQVVAPSCSPGPQDVQVCTDLGCDTEVGAFNCTGPPAPVITSYIGNMGPAGTFFFIIGDNFGQPGLAVSVCGTAATAALQGDGRTLRVTAPACGQSGCVEVQVCNNFGCDSDPMGYCYPLGTPFIRGDANNSGGVDLSDAVSIFNDLFIGNPARALCRDALDTNDSGDLDISDGIRLLNFLFQGASSPPAPYPNPGLDPTADSLPGC
jgi:hypothetical protein